MARNQHSSFRENIPAYALGALDEKDAAALASHLNTCASCRDELADYRALSDGLLTLTPPHAPPAALRRQLQKHLPSARKSAPPRFAFPFGQLAIGAALILLLALNLFSIFQMKSFQQQQAQLTRQVQVGQSALALLAYPGTQTLPINGQNISGTVLMEKDRNVLVVIVWNLPSLPENQTYQLWLNDSKGDRTSAALFLPEEGQPFTEVSVFSQQSLSSFTGLGVTVEPARGSPRPTGPRLFQISF